MSEPSSPVLEVSDLELVYRVRGIDRPVLRGLSFSIEQGGTLEVLGPGADDRPTTTGGTWSLDGDHLELRPEGSSPLHYVIDDLGSDCLVVDLADSNSEEPEEREPKDGNDG